MHSYRMEFHTQCKDSFPFFLNIRSVDTLLFIHNHLWSEHLAIIWVTWVSSPAKGDSNQQLQHPRRFPSGCRLCWKGMHILMLKLRHFRKEVKIYWAKGEKRSTRLSMSLEISGQDMLLGGGKPRFQSVLTGLFMHFTSNRNQIKCMSCPQFCPSLVSAVITRLETYAHSCSLCQANQFSAQYNSFQSIKEECLHEHIHIPSWWLRHFAELGGMNLNLLRKSHPQLQHQHLGICY